MHSHRLAWFLALTISGCGFANRLPPTPGESSSGFGYVPLDGLAVQPYDAEDCMGNDDQGKKRTYRPTLESLPDLSVRFAVASFSTDGTLTFGPAKVTVQGGTYRAVLDYVNVDDIPVEFYMRKFVRTASGQIASRSLLSRLEKGEEVESYEVRSRTARTDTVNVKSLIAKGDLDQVTIPVYVGIGMRLSADLRALKSGIALTSLGAMGAAAEANALSGTLTVQTLGVTGKSIATALPLPSKLDQTTIENGILAIGSTRAFIYGGQSDVTITARVVGLYSPVGTDPRLISAIYSELAKEKPFWHRYCTTVK